MEHLQQITFYNFLKSQVCRVCAKTPDFYLYIGVKAHGIFAEQDNRRHVDNKKK